MQHLLRVSTTDLNRLKNGVILLVSPGPIDGYPPVQYQAKLFAQAGYQVVVVTKPLGNSNDCDFRCEGVSVKTVKNAQRSRASEIFARLCFVAAIAMARRSINSLLVAEISYDPDGIWYSHNAPFKRRCTLRVSHLHEALIDPEKRYVERAASKIMQSSDRIVVADSRRGDLLKSQLGLSSKPLVIPNYPLLCETNDSPIERDFTCFRVSYAGSIGFHQGFDAIVRSIPLWTQPSRLHIAGNDRTPQAIQIMELAEKVGVSDRVVFAGLLPLDDVVNFLSASNVGLTLLCPIHDQWRFAAGASNKHYQCMQAGIPQISDTNPDVPELIEHQGLGLCVNPDDPDAIAAAVNHYISNPDECKIAGAKAHAYYRSQYHYQIPFQQLLDWIETARFNENVSNGAETNV